MLVEICFLHVPVFRELLLLYSGQVLFYLFFLVLWGCNVSRILFLALLFQSTCRTSCLVSSMEMTWTRVYVQQYWAVCATLSSFLQLTQPDRFGYKAQQLPVLFITLGFLFGPYFLCSIFIYSVNPNICYSLSVWRFQILLLLMFFATVSSSLSPYSSPEQSVNFECYFMRWFCLLMFGSTWGAHSNLSLFS